MRRCETYAQVACSNRASKCCAVIALICGGLTLGMGSERREPPWVTMPLFEFRDDSPVLALYYKPHRAPVQVIPGFILWRDGELVWSQHEALSRHEFSRAGLHDLIDELEVWRASIGEEGAAELVQYVAEADSFVDFRQNRYASSPVDGAHAVFAVCDEDVPLMRNHAKFVWIEARDRELLYVGGDERWRELGEEDRQDVIETLPQRVREYRAPWDSLREWIETVLGSVEDFELLEEWKSERNFRCRGATNAEP